MIFFFMIGYYIYFIVVDSQDVVNNSYNHRIDGQADTVVRGTIYSKSGKELAYTDTKGTEDDLSDDTREYPYGKIFAHVVGIKTHGKYGLEKLCNFDLLSTQSSPLQKIIDDFTNTTERGCDVYTTLSVSLQKAAYNSLGNNDGAVFIMNPDTGEIYTMASKPSYNPETIDEIWDDLANDPNDSRLLNRATQGKYIPGSIFKIVTTLEYIRENKKYNNFSYYCNGSAKFKGYSIKCFDGHAHYNEDLTDAFAYSCNSAFSTIGDGLNVNKFAKTAEQLLFNSKLPLEVDYNQSVFPLDKESKQFDITQTSIGQGKTTVSPAHMAMIVSAIANDGVLKKPYVVDYVENSNGEIQKKAEQKDYKTLMTKDEAAQLNKYMRAVCEYGTGKIMANADYKAYGKTGTAELDKDDNINSWFIGYAKKGKKKIAIAVVLENMRQGNNSAVNCAKEIFDTYFD
ncbi:MAG: penicillin-binding transpeptidase domain-containing protein [Eubacterium sp.]